MFRLDAFSLSDLVQCRAAVRRAGEGAGSMEEAAQAVVRYLRDHLVDKDTGEPACPLVRFYKTHRYDDLPVELQDTARTTAGNRRVAPDVNCLTLLASAGDVDEWNDRRRSRHHQVVPLGSDKALEELPMVHQLVIQLGLEPRDVVEPAPELFADLDQRSYDVFYVPDAVGSASVPAQDDFVLPFGIRSVLGFGGVLPSGALVAAIMFSRTSISAETAELFRTMAVSIKLAVLPFAYGPVFTREPASSGGGPVVEAAFARLRSEALALGQLLEVGEETTIGQALRLEAALDEAEQRAEQLALSRQAEVAAEARAAAVIGSSIDAIIIIDAEGRIVEFNPAAVSMFGYQREEAVDRPMAELIVPPSFRCRHYQGVARYLRTGVGPILGRRIEVTGMRRDGEEFPVELTVIAVAGQDPPLFSGFLRDITERKAAERALIQSREHAARIARTLQDSLLPPALATVPGVDVAARYHPAGDGSEVGGDFYDLFQTGTADWWVVLGDVCGKGAPAAALTALARYTLRAAAITTPDPAQVLAALNEAVLLQQPDQFCTVLCGRLHQDGPGWRMTVASGGHPLPVLLGADGRVREFGGLGTLVGGFADAHFAQTTVALGLGDVVVMFTDGVTEAKGEHGLFGEERWCDLLLASVGLPPSDVANGIEAAVLDYQGHDASDDIAILALGIRRSGESSR